MENVIFRKSWFKTLKRWEPGKVYEFICLLERFVDGKELNVPENMMDFWDQVEPLLKSDLSKYENVVERNRQNGKSGGRPKKPTTTQENPLGILETQDNPKNLKEKEIEKEKEIDKEKDIDNNINTNNKNLILEDEKFYKSNMIEIGHIMDSLKVSKSEAIEIHKEFLDSMSSVFK